MDPRYTQWRDYRPTRRPAQPSSPASDQNGIIRPVQQPSQWNNKQQQPQRKSCCGGRRENR